MIDERLEEIKQALSQPLPELGNHAATRAQLGETRQMVRDLLVLLEDREGELSALRHAGHMPDCGGEDPAACQCACGWLQQETAHEYIERLKAENAELLQLLEKASLLNAALSTPPTFAVIRAQKLEQT